MARTRCSRFAAFEPVPRPEAFALGIRHQCQCWVYPDYAALTPLIWEHVNPYGRFELDMNARLALL